jgi:hypothetical protein
MTNFKAKITGGNMEGEAGEAGLTEINMKEVLLREAA